MSEYMCYICKLGWFEYERPIELHNRKGIMLCAHCYNTMDKREAGTADNHHFIAKDVLS